MLTPRGSVLQARVSESRSITNVVLPVIAAAQSASLLDSKRPPLQCRVVPLAADASVHPHVLKISIGRWPLNT